MKTPYTMTRRAVGSSAFTLIEMLLVLAIISILIGAGIYQMGGAKDTARIEATRMTIIKMKSNIQEYELATRGGPPSTQQGLKALVSKPGGDSAPRIWRQVLKEVPNDQWGNEFQYRRPGKEGSEYEIFSAGPDGQLGTEDDISSEQDE